MQTNNVSSTITSYVHSYETENTPQASQQNNTPALNSAIISAMEHAVFFVTNQNKMKSQQTTINNRNLSKLQNNI